MIAKASNPENLVRVMQECAVRKKPPAGQRYVCFCNYRDVYQCDFVGNLDEMCTHFVRGHTAIQ
jgi:hypothetical protein